MLASITNLKRNLTTESTCFLCHYAQVYRSHEKKWGALRPEHIEILNVLRSRFSCVTQRFSRVHAMLPGEALRDNPYNDPEGDSSNSTT